MNARRWTIVLFTLVVGAVGCGRSPNQLCEDFVKECGSENSVAACQARAATLEAEAQQDQCLQLWDQYVGCVDNLQSLCTAADQCASQRDDLATYCHIHFM